MSLGPHDLVLSKDKAGNVTAAGFTVDSASASGGEPALLLRGGARRGGIKLDGLAIPAGLASMAQLHKGRQVPVDGGVAPDALVEQLLLLARPRADSRLSRRRKKGKGARRRTRRSRQT